MPASPTRSPRSLGPANRDTRKPPREPLLAQIASFVDLFVWLMVLKSFLLPLFIIPTGSMAETLYGEHATHTCPNCGTEYPIGFQDPQGPAVIECPNCRWQQRTARAETGGVKLHGKAGDRIVVHGWPFEFGLGPQRWDVVVFKNPNEPDVNYIKRLIGLPGDTIEIIDGDIWVKEKDAPSLHVARKTRNAQEALWLPYYDHDYRPRLPSTETTHRAVVVPDARPAWSYYFPRWAPLGGEGWADLTTRVPRFDGPQRPRAELQFVTDVEGTTQPGIILDTLGYNGYEPAFERDPQGRLHPTVSQRGMHIVSDVRLSTDVRIDAGDGYVELSLSKYFDRFFARLYADGRVTLERQNQNQNASTRELWSEARVAPPRQPTAFSIGHTDCEIVVEVNGKPLLRSSPQQLAIDPDTARQRSLLRMPCVVRIAAERVRAALAHVRIDRDGYYTADVGNQRELGNAVQGHPITLRDDAYFMCGDNSTRSLDGRWWLPPLSPEGEAEVAQALARGEHDRVRMLRQGRLGPALRARYEAGQYEIGTVPADQLLGRAFLVYWPGFLPLSEKLPANVPNILPDFGHVRWIH